MIEKTNLDCKYPVGNGVAHPEFKDGETTIIGTKSADMSGGMVSTTASSENRSAKFKNPNVKQDIPAAGRNQYES